MVYFGGFFAKLGHFAGFFLYMSLISQDTPPNCVFTVFAGFSLYYLPERSAKMRCAGRRSRDIIFHSIGRPVIIVYLEYQSVCPIIGIGSPPPPPPQPRCSFLGCRCRLCWKAACPFSGSGNFCGWLLAVSGAGPSERFS